VAQIRDLCGVADDETSIIGYVFMGRWAAIPKPVTGLAAAPPRIA